MIVMTTVVMMVLSLMIIQAAMFGAGCWAQDSCEELPGVAVTTSGDCSWQEHFAFAICVGLLSFFLLIHFA